MIKKNSFLDTFKRDNHSHAYLFTGTDGEEFRKIVEGVQSETEVRPFDTHTVEEEGSISIETIRRLRSKLALKPHSSSHHLVVVPRAQTLTPEAQNALLKLLEEPSSPTIYLLFVPDERALLPTVSSRCQRVGLGRSQDTHEVRPELGGLASLSLKEQFDLAQDLSKDPDLVALLNTWIMELRRDLLAGDPKKGVAIRTILKAKDRIETTQVNRRLLLEDLFLSLKFPELVPNEKRLV